MRTVWLLFALALFGCEAEIPEGVFACSEDADCPPELVCRTNVSRCFRTRAPSDAGG
ncbi:MAG: hypothetical protein VYE22_28730 [Myxococcota bacterium]|nr:hypothetical protein [Myxococcota bacterium]